METDHLCIGGGPAGVFAALTAAEHGKRCIILEHNKQLGRKLRITGKGRCNLTNNCDRDTLMANIPANGKFLYSAFSRCTPQDVMAYFEKLGVPLKTERGNRVFPVSDRAEDIVQALQKAVRLAGIPVVHGDAAELLLEKIKGVPDEESRVERILKTAENIGQGRHCSPPAACPTPRLVLTAQAIVWQKQPVTPLCRQCPP